MAIVNINKTCSEDKCPCRGAIQDFVNRLETLENQINRLETDHKNAQFQGFSQDRRTEDQTFTDEDLAAKLKRLEREKSELEESLEKEKANFEKERTRMYGDIANLRKNLDDLSDERNQARKNLEKASEELDGIKSLGEPLLERLKQLHQSLKSVPERY